MEQPLEDLAERVRREMELAPLAGRYYDERCDGVRVPGQFDDLVSECSDEGTAGEAVDVFGLIDVLLNAGLGQEGLD